MSERPEGAETVGIRRKKGKKGNIIALKWRISQAPVLVHADPDAQFHLETDTLNYTYGAVLSQKQTDGHHHPISFMSKSMNPAEWNYGIPNKEALAIVKGLQNWCHWLK